MSITLNELVGKTVHVHIQYIDTDNTTVLNENKFSGVVQNVDATNGIAIQPDDDKAAITVIPPALEACSRDGDDVYKINWSVFRTQAKRSDGQHEWWEWKLKV
jgi:hypothetical protein